METIYKMPQDKSICIKFKSSEAFEDALGCNEECLKFAYSNGTIVDVYMSSAGRNVAYVRVFDLPPELPDNALSSVLGQYGIVKRMVREKFPSGFGLNHLHTGVRGVYVDIEKEIPAALEVCDWKARIFYDGLKNKCFLCNLEGHRKDSCPQRKTQKRKEKRKEVSYAEIVESGVVSLLDETDSVGEEMIEEELIDAEIIQVTESEAARQQRLQEEEAEQKIRQGKALEKLTNLASAIQEAVNKQQASERRAQFAASGSTEMLRPKKAARKSTK